MEAAGLREALLSLVDQQNGPPLLSPRHKEAWEEAMRQARSVLDSPAGAPLLAELAALREVAEAARPFAEYVGLRGELMPDDTLVDDRAYYGPTLGQARKLAAALGKLP